MHLIITKDEFGDSIIDVRDSNNQLLLTKRVTESIDHLLKIYLEQHGLKILNENGVYIVKEIKT